MLPDGEGSNTTGKMETEASDNFRYPDSELRVSVRLTIDLQRSRLVLDVTAVTALGLRLIAIA